MVGIALGLHLLETYSTGLLMDGQPLSHGCVCWSPENVVTILDRSKCLTGPTASSFETGKCACPIGATTLKIDCKSTQVWLSPHQKCTYNSIPESFLGTVHGSYSCNPTRKKDIAVPRSLHGGTEATTCLQAGVC